MGVYMPRPAGRRDLPAPAGKPAPAGRKAPPGKAAPAAAEPTAPTTDPREE